MKINKKFKAAAIITLLFFSIDMVLFSPNAYTQSINRIEDKIGGSGSTTTEEDSSNDNTFLYVAVGIIVVGLIIWKVVLDKKEPKPKEDTKTDSTKASLDNYFYENISDQELELEKIRNQIPVELYFGLRNNERVAHEKNLSFGLRFRL
jgi:hypothetical protein